MKKIVLLVSILWLMSTAVVLESVSPVLAQETIYIRDNGSVDPSTAPIQRDGNIYTFTDNIYDEIVVQRDNIVVDGTGYTLQGTQSETGIYLYGRSNVSIQNMYIIDFAYGIYLRHSSNNNIHGNQITNNDRGIYLRSSSDNFFYHNNFIDNTEQIRLRSTRANVWDDGYPSGGNYWSDYTGVDQNRGENQNMPGIDGIGDTPYIIDDDNGDNIDYYPLMNNWSPPDTTPPIVSIISPENKTYSVTAVPLTFMVSGLTSWIGYSLDGQANVTVSGNATLPSLSDGIHTITVYAKNTAGNTGYSDTIHFTIDTVAPNTEIVSPENKTYTTNSVSLIFTVNEPTDWIGYSLDGQSNYTITGDTTLADLSDGMHSLIVYASDILRNMGSSDIVYFTVDTTLPSITILQPEIKTYDTTVVPLTFTLDESVSWMAYSLDGKTNATITGNITLSDLSEGLHSLIVYVRDTAGNTGTSEIVYFTIEPQQQEPQPEPKLAEPSQLWIVAVIVIIAGVGFAITFYIAYDLFRNERRNNLARARSLCYIT